MRSLEVRSIGTGFRDKKHTGSFLSPAAGRPATFASPTSVSQPLRTIFVYSLKKRRGVHHCIRLAWPSKHPSLRNGEPSHAPLRVDDQVGSFEATHLQTRNPLGQPDAPLRSKRRIYSFATLVLALALLCNMRQRRACKTGRCLALQRWSDAASCGRAGIVLT